MATLGGVSTKAWCAFGAAWIFLIFVLVLFFQTQRYIGPNPIIRQRLEVKEAFQGSTEGAAAEAPIAEEAGKGLAPAVAGLELPRQPYTLLNDWMQPKQPQDAVQGAAGNPPSQPAAIPDSVYGQTVANVYAETGVLPRAAYSAQTCYEADFKTRLEKTGNFRQMTNNYKRGDPDSCTAPNQEVALGYYRVDPVPFEGCISKNEWPLRR